MMGDMLQSCLTAGEAHEVIGQYAPRLFPGGSGALFTPATSGGVLEAVAVWGPAPPRTLVLSADQCWALRRGRVYTVKQPVGGPHCEHMRDGSSDGYICVPMMAQGEALGLLSHRLGDEASLGGIDSESKLALTVAEHLSLALANLSLRETLRNQSIRDPLTGLFNRRHMQATLERELLRAARGGHSVGMIALDVDHFKTYNDTHGHSTGDEVLRALGAVLQTHVRDQDLVCRTGGEEFMFILPGASREATVQRAEQLRVAATTLGGGDGQGIQSISVSLGVATFPDDGRTGEAVMRAADEALYAAKKHGRNRVVVAGDASMAGLT